MHRLKIFQTTAFRWTLGAAATVALSIAAMGGFLYWQTVGYFRVRIDTALQLEADSLGAESRRVLILRLEKSLAIDPRRTKAYGLFVADGTRLAGDLAALPNPLPPAGRPAEMMVAWPRRGAAEPGRGRALVRPLPDGSVLVLGRAEGDLQDFDALVTRAMALAIVPAAALALAVGAFVSLGTLRRLEAVRHACALIMEGQVGRRLPVGRRRDEFDRLSELVNRMLDEIERLLDEVRGAGDAVAHDLRTPLTRLRARLDRALDPEARHAPLPEVLQKSIADVDQVLTTVTAILRLAEVEQEGRQGGFGPVNLEDVVEAVTELYGPIAEEKGVALAVERAPVGTLRGDRDLVFEAVANIVDNAVKFTPPGGRVALALSERGGLPSLVVADTGPGIPAAESQAVLRRFYRGDRSRHLPGTGLGLSLVAAVARLHGFALSIGSREGGGCQVTLLCGSRETTAG